MDASGAQVETLKMLPNSLHVCNSLRMSEQQAAVVPDWDQCDRMRKALRHAHLGPQEMADYLGVSRQSAGNWINGRVEPSSQTLRLWAQVTGVSYRWLCHGNEGPHPSASDNMQRSPSTVAA